MVNTPNTLCNSAPAIPHTAAASPCPLSVLIVEDLEDAAQSYADLLTLCGHSVRVASCGADALQQAAAETPDVVLLDIGLPDIDGWKVAERLRPQCPGKQPIIVVVSGYGTDTDRCRSADVGCDLHLVKPANPAALTALLERIARILSQRREVAATSGNWHNSCRPGHRTEHPGVQATT